VKNLERTRRYLVAASLLWVVAPPPARAQKARAVEAANAYTAAHNLPQRTIEVGPAARRVRRIFVPVLANTYDNFLERFGQRGGGVVLRAVTTQTHVGMQRNPGEIFYWARDKVKDPQWAHLLGLLGSHSGGGHLLAVQLDAPEIQHLNGWLEARTRDQLYCQGNCMEWLSNAEVAPGQPLFHALGLTRSRDGANIQAKLVHAANDKIEVVGVTVDSAEHFNRMTDQELLGSPPKGGIDDAIR
jgi:hypothetical protein